MRLLTLLAALAAGASQAQSVPWYFVATALNEEGQESAYSNQTSKVMGPGDSIDLKWIPPTQNTDGTPLTDLAGYRFYAGTQMGVYPLSMAVDNPTLTAVIWSDVAGPLPMLPADPTQPPVIIWVLSPPPAAVTVTMAGSGAGPFNLIVTGTAQVHVHLDPSGAVFDWLKVGGQTSASIPGVLPGLGGNNDGRSANGITFTAPINGWTDLDGPTMTGVSATVDGVSKQLVRNGTTWAVGFP